MDPAFVSNLDYNYLLIDRKNVFFFPQNPVAQIIYIKQKTVLQIYAEDQ